MTRTHPATTPDTLSPETIDAYHRNGFVRIPGVITPEEAAEFYRAALAVSERKQSLTKSAVFTQLVNVWMEDEAMRRLTLHPNVGAVAERLAGIPLRLWHDQILIKQPHNQVA